MSSSKASSGSLLALFGPGLLIAATGVGAGDGSLVGDVGDVVGAFVGTLVVGPAVGDEVGTPVGNTHSPATQAVPVSHQELLPHAQPRSLIA